MLCFSILIIGGVNIPYADAKNSDFVIENGVLTKYKGKSKKVTIPKSVKSIGDNAFSDCKNITSVVIPKNVKSIGNGAFSGCKKLSDISIPKTLKSFGAHPFYDTKWANEYMEKNTFLIVNDILLSADGKQIGKELIIPEGVKVINSAAFNYWTNIESVIIPEGCEEIGNIAFNMCENIKNVSIPKTVKSIEMQAFYACYSLESLSLSNNITFIGDDAFFDCKRLTIYCQNKSYAQKYAKENKIPVEIRKK